MENIFVNGMLKETEKTTTENGANAYNTTGRALTDLFAIVGSLRNRKDSEVIRLFEDAYKEDALLTMKMLFYARDIRDGLGERKIFKTILHNFATNHTISVMNNLYIIADFGRWDDLYALIGTPLEDIMWGIIRMQLVLDIEAYNRKESISLLTKWLKSINTSSNESRRIGRMTAKNLGLTEREYRIVLSSLRKYLEIVEVKMSAKEWEEIEFEKVPSLAMLNYRNAFSKQAAEKFVAYLGAVKKGEKKINAATLYPYNIIESLGGLEPYGRYFGVGYNEVAELQWKALPNYITEDVNALVIADTSGSMYGRPMATAIGLAIYFAERNTGAFANKFMTFSSVPKYVNLKGDTLQEKINGIESIVDNTNLKKAFQLVLDTCIDYRVPQSDVPKSLIVISDGEIDEFCYDKRKWSFLAVMEEKFNAAGYEMPKVVMWNVESRQNTFLDQIGNSKIQFISGQSASAFKSLIKGTNLSAYELMLETLNNPIYDVVQI